MLRDLFLMSRTPLLSRRGMRSIRPLLFLHQIHGTAFYFLEDHPDVNTENALENHSDCAGNGQNENKGRPAWRELAAVAIQPYIAGVGELKYGKCDECGAEKQSNPQGHK